jgi:glutathione synthase/RimK-type ligase-like ATP-grasp enzyme
MRVLITGGRAPVALDLARQFARGGARVIVADSAPCYLARSSRAVARAYRVPAPRMQPDAFAAALAEIVDRERIDLLVPTCEEVFYVAHFADRLRSRADVFCSPIDVLRGLHDKWRFNLFAASLGVGVPESWLLQSRDDVATLPAGASELVLKPVFSRFAAHTLVRPAAGVLAALDVRPERPWIAQRFVAGSEVCTYSVARDGRLTAHVAYRPLWRAGTVGSSFYFAPAHSVAIEEAVARIVAAVRYTGQIAFDFIEAPGGKLAVLECNPRATSGVHLFGPNDGLPAAFNGAHGAPARPARPRARMLAPAMAMLGPRQAMRGRNFGRYARDFFAARDAIWSRADPLPALYLYVGLGAFVIEGMRRGVNPVVASTYDIEWDGERIA